MAKCGHRNDVGSLVLDRPSSGNHFRLWSAFSGSTFRRKIFDAVSCGSSSRYRRRDVKDDDDDDEETAVTAAFKTNTIGAVALKSSDEEEEKPKQKEKPKARSEKLWDLLSVAEAETDVETRRKEEALEELKRVVRDLQRVDDAAAEAARKVRLMAKEDAEARSTLAMLGAIPPLVGMIDVGGDDDDQQDEDEADDAKIAALYALLNIGIGNDANKAAIVKAGAVHKMLKLIESPDDPNPAVAEAVVANFLGLSALDANKPVIGSSGAIPFLAKTFKNLDNKSSSQAREDAIRALNNLSIYQANISFILETGLIAFLLNSLGDMDVSERILSILSNVVSVPEGRRAISTVPDAFPILVDVLNWTDAPGCQEKASYVLMVMAHKAYGDRQAMIEAGIVSSLLELTLLGSTLAQKRASRILECLRVDKGKQVSENQGSCTAVSAPIYGSSSSSLPPNGVSKDCLTEEDDMMSEEKKAVKQLVQQSLQNNMRRIIKRANLPQDFVPSEHLKSLTASSTSKSLPF